MVNYLGMSIYDLYLLSRTVSLPSTWAVDLSVIIPTHSSDNKDSNNKLQVITGTLKHSCLPSKPVFTHRLPLFSPSSSPSPRLPSNAQG